MKPIIAEKLSNVNYRIMMDMAYVGGQTDCDYIYIKTLDLWGRTRSDWFNVRKVNNERAANFEAINNN